MSLIPSKERRHLSDEMAHMNGDRATKRVVVATLCAIAGTFTVTICGLAIFNVFVPDSIDRLATYVIGVLSGMLINTGVSAALTPRTGDTNISGPANVQVAPGTVADVTTSENKGD